MCQDDDDEDQGWADSQGGLQDPVDPKKHAEDIGSHTASDKTADTASASSTTISSQEKVLLSRRAQKALGKLRYARKGLTESSIREELEAAYGVEDAGLLAEATLETTFPSARKNETIPEEGEDASHHDAQGQDMMIDIEVEVTNKAAQTQVDKVDRSQKTRPANVIQASQECVDSPREREACRQSNATAHQENQQPPDPPGTRNVSFAKAVHNSNSLRRGNLQTTLLPKNIPQNLYEKKSDAGILHANRPQKSPAKIDKTITFKKNDTRPHTHWYTLRLKTIATKSEEDGHQILKEALQQFLEIVLQADPKTILPPYLELDRNDKSVSDLSSAFTVSSVDSFHALKKYFF